MTARTVTVARFCHKVCSKGSLPRNTIARCASTAIIHGDDSSSSRWKTVRNRPQNSWPLKSWIKSPYAFLNPSGGFRRHLSSAASKEDGDVDIHDLVQEMPAEDERMINELMEYKAQNGDCHVPAGDSKFAESERQRLGVSDDLVAWVRRQRQQYKAFQKRVPKNELVAKQGQVRFLVLDALGFMWSEREAQWQRSFNRLEAFKARTGTLEPDREKDSQLWNWVDQQRKACQKDKITEERKRMLQEIGFVFDLHEASWWVYHEKLSEYVKENGDAKVPGQYDPDPALGVWVSRQRRNYQAGQMSDDRKAALASIGFAFSVYDEAWENHYNALVDFHSENGHTRVPRSMGPLFHWVDRQRRLLRAKAKDQHALSEREGKIAALNDIDFDWRGGGAEDRTRRLMDLTFNVEVHEERWMENLNKLKEFKEKNGHFSVPLEKEEYQDLNAWVKHQRYLKKRNKLAAERVDALEKMGFQWTGRIARWDFMYEKLVRFHTAHGHTRVPSRNSELYRWLNHQRQLLRQSEDQSSEQQSKGQMEQRLATLSVFLDQ